MSMNLNIPCAYCGNETRIRANHAGDTWILYCTKCPARMEGTREDNPRFQHMDQRDSLTREWSKRYGSK